MFAFSIANGNSWQIEGRDEAGERFVSILGLSESEKKRAVDFPFYPPQISSTYTFFDFTKDTLEYFDFLNRVGRNETIAIRSSIQLDRSDRNVFYSLAGNMSIISRAVTIRNEIWGGILIHGIMVLHEKGAIVIAGDTGAGKTTTVRRLPENIWRRMSDDRTLVVRDQEGDYYAYPWPGGKAYRQPELRYDISKGYPLRGVFTVVKNEKNSLEKIEGLSAVAILKYVVDQAMELPDPSIDPEGVGEMRKLRLDNLISIVKKTPIYELKVNLEDPFSDELESVL